MKTITEIRVITHTPNPPQAFVAVIFSDNTTSTLERAFPDANAAALFADGMRAGLHWAQALEPTA